MTAAQATADIVEDAPILRAGIPVLARSGGRTQIGCDPGRAVVIEPPGWVDTSALHDLLHSMRIPRPLAEITDEAIALGLSSAALASLVDQLVAADLAYRPHRDVGRKFRVRLHGVGPIADGLAASLRSAHFTIERSRRRPNTGWAGVGVWRGGLVVLTDALVPDPALVATLMRHGTPHLAIRLRDDVGIVGPLVLPRLSSCLACADRYRHELDADWPLISAQLVGRTGSGSAATIAATIAFAHAQIEHVRDGWRREGTGVTQPTTVDHTIEVRARGAEVHRRAWPPHPLCDCTS